MAEIDKVYKCLNPVGIQMPIKTFPLAPRLDTLDGKEIILSITGEPDITIPLEKKLVSEYASDIVSICKGDRPAATDPLTPRERQVLQLIAEGYTDKEISDKLCISVRTVHRHHANIRKKLNLKRTAELVRYAISQGYVNGQP